MDNIRQIVERGNLTLAFDGPLKDTVLVPGRGFTVIRFVANNPGKTKKNNVLLVFTYFNWHFACLGYWLFHCHISEHMAQGMALAFKVGIHSEMVKPPAHFPRCGNFF